MESSVGGVAIGGVLAEEGGRSRGKKHAPRLADAAGTAESEEMKMKHVELKKKEANRKRWERRKRIRQLKKQNNPENHSDSAPIEYHHNDFQAYLEALLAARPDSARNEYIEQHAGVLLLSCGGAHLVESMDPKKDFYLVPWLLDPGEPKYYERLVVNNTCTRKGDYDATWSRDLVSDQQYVHFYSKLEECIKDQVPSWYGVIDCCFDEAIRNDLKKKRLDYQEKAFCIAKQTEFSNLERSDIYNCIMDLIEEKSLVKDRLHYSREFHVCLLECGFGEKKISNEYLKWGRGVPHPLSEPHEMQDYKEWLKLPGIRGMNKEEKIIELMKYHDKKSKEDCSTRIRYLRLKLELVKSLGLIPEEADTN